MYPDHPSESDYIEIVRTRSGSVTVTCKEPLKNCLVVIHSSDAEEPLKVAYLNSSNPIDDLLLVRSEDSNLVVFTWADSKPESFLNSSVILVRHISTIISSEFSCLLFHHTLGIVMFSPKIILLYVMSAGSSKKLLLNL